MTLEIFPLVLTRDMNKEILMLREAEEGQNWVNWEG